MFTANPLARYIAKLERRGRLPDGDRDALLDLPGSFESFGANETIAQEGVRSMRCALVESGFVSRVKMLENGARQLVAFHISGDFVDLQSILFTRNDHGLHAHSDTQVYWVAHEDILSLVRQRPIVARTLWLDTLIDAAIFREWTVNVGHRRARERIAHLFLEMAARFEANGRLTNNTFEFPVTQNALADALGLSLVHLNKTLQILRKDFGVEVGRRMITLNDRAKLGKLAGFDPSYLYLTDADIMPIG